MIEGNKRVIVFIGNYWLSIYGNRLSIQRDKGQFLWLKEPEKLVENQGGTSLCHSNLSEGNRCTEGFEVGSIWIMDSWVDGGAGE